MIDNARIPPDWVLWATARAMVLRDLDGCLARCTAQEENLAEDGDETGAEVWRRVRARVGAILEPAGRA